MPKIRPFILGMAFILVLSVTLPACSPNSPQNHSANLNMAPLADMPMEVQSAPVVVQQAYQFAAANPEILEQIPCYCGCGAMGHTSNYSCYFTSEGSEESLTFDPHALGCSICVDITQDTMRLLEQGQSITEIRATIDETYARFGPSNIP